MPSAAGGAPAQSAVVIHSLKVILEIRMDRFVEDHVLRVALQLAARRNLLMRTAATIAEDRLSTHARFCALLAVER